MVGRIWRYHQCSRKGHSTLSWKLPKLSWVILEPCKTYRKWRI